MKLTVNGQARDFTAPARTHLADLLREQFGLTGTHLGCEQGVCGACTVLLDGAPARACLLYAHEAAGHEVTTIEGLDDDPTAAALRAAFTRHHALQCGYCTPGMMMTAVDIVLRLGAVDEARIREELAGNLCRCTGYRGIVRAVAEVAARTATPVQAAPALAAPALATPSLAGPVPAIPLAVSLPIALPQSAISAPLGVPSRGSGRLDAGAALRPAQPLERNPFDRPGPRSGLGHPVRPRPRRRLPARRPPHPA